MSHQHQHQQPASELIANALIKIKKLAGNKKHADLSQRCQDLVDNIHEVLSPQYAARVAAAAAATACSQPLQTHPAQEHQQQQEQEPKQLDAQQEPAPDTPGSSTQENAQQEQSAVPAGDPAETAVAVGSDSGPGKAEVEKGPAASGDSPSAAAAAASSSAEAPAAAATAAVPVLLPAPPADMVQRTESAISDAAALAVMQVLQLAVQTLRPNIVEVALDLIHKLIAFRYLQGAAHFITADRSHDEDGSSSSSSTAGKQHPTGDAAAGSPTAAGEQAHGSDGRSSSPSSQLVSPQGMAVQIICSCDEVPDEGVEVLVLRGLLTATTSLTFTLHGQALLLAVRTCYNIHLMSRSEVNQTTAKATLTQMLNVVFQRMEAGSVKIAVKPIAVADMLGTANLKGSSSDIVGMTAAVQGFLNNVVAAAGYGATVETPEQLKQSVAAAIIGPRASMELSEALPATPAVDGTMAAADAVSDSDDEEDEKNTFHLAPRSSAEVTAGAGAEVQPIAGAGASSSSAAATTGGSSGDGGGSTSEPAATEAPGSSRSTPHALDGASTSSKGAATAADGHGSGKPHLQAAGSSTPASSGVALLLKDAFLVFRALCKLSIRTSDSVTVSDPTAVRGKLLALELLKVLLENSGPTFRTNERFTAAIRQYLCLSLLKNSASSIPAALQLSASIFLSLLKKFRSALKAEVGVFFPMVMLKVLEPPAGPGAAGGAGAAATQTSLAVNSYSYKVVVLRCLREVCADGQLLVDLFVNYDCDLGSSNLFERLINGLVKMAQAALPVNADSQQVQQEQWLRQEALQCLASAAGALLKWYRQMSGQGVSISGSNMDAEDDPVPGSLQSPAVPGSKSMRGSSTSLSGLSLNVEATSGSAGGDDNTTTPKAAAEATGSGGGGGGGDALSRKRAYKEKWQEGVALFNQHPKKGIALLQGEEMVGRSPEDVAAFLAKTEGLDKTLIGDYLGEHKEFNLKVMHAFVDAMDFTDLEFDTAIRRFLQGFRLPGEAQKIDRLMEKFAERYVSCNSGAFKSADVCYVLAYSVIMLNTDAHNPQVKNKMSCEAFLKNNRGINDGADLPADFMRDLYERIVSNEIKMKDDLLDGNKAAAEAAAQRGNLLMNALWSIVGGGRAAESAEPSDDAIKRTLDYLHDRAKGATYFTATDPDTVRPMLELIWAPLLGAFSLLFDEYSDPRLLAICLAGFEAATCLAAQLGVNNLRDVFVNSLCNFTHLHSPSTMKTKNGLAFKSLINVALAVGNHLGERWLEVLRCISRWELLQQISSGMPTDAVLFASGASAGDKGGTGRAAAAALKDQLKKHVGGALPPGAGTAGPGAAGTAEPAGGPAGVAAAGAAGGPTSMDSLAMSEASIKRSHIGASGREEAGSDLVVPAAIINSVDTAQLNKVYVSSSALDSDAIVAFVRCLVAISLDELRDAAAPRVFSLTKIVEISHFNMGRIRLVWSRIWAVLSQYFIAVGCHSNLAVAMYAVDSLRQLAMKFLEKDELSNYTFQNDFMRPFVMVLRQSQAVEIRELIIRCVSQMVLARVNNVKSGWKSMFMVFTTAAGDPDPTIVRLAFDTIEKIVREYFGHITETETTTFMDCVNCLIAFTNNPHSLEVALNAIAFLRFCASRLAEGSIGDLPDAVPALEPDRLGATRMVPLDQQLAAPASASSRRSLEVHAAAAVGGEPADAASSSLQHQPGSLKFVDRDEHVYFWFPLLAGLSELTFDPRPEIRRSALEVLFDVLKCHGGSFAESFWSRIFSRVLLPIFDHVRAEVTDTTTFTSERRRQQEDAWLYETCTHCLQHMVDLFGQFYELMRHLLPRLLLLLRGFISRSHASLASVGVAAYARLVANCGEQLDAAGWQEVVGMLAAVMQDTLPDAAELVTPQARASSMGDSLHAAAASIGAVSPTAAAASPTAAAAAAAAPPPGQGLGQPRPPYTLREGVGMRRLLKFRVAASVQLLLVQAASEIYAEQYMHLGAGSMVVLADSLQQVAAHARGVNTDLQLRKRLATQQAEDRVQEERQVPDPPLLRQETDASHAYLSMLLHINSSSDSIGSNGSSKSSSFQWPGAAAVQQATQASHRLVELAYAVLVRFSQGGDSSTASSTATSRSSSAALLEPVGYGSSSSRYGGGSSSSGVKFSHASGAVVSLAPPLVVYSSFAPLVVSTLKALAALDDGTFQAELGRFFPVLTQLITCDYATADVQRALSELFLARVGPLLTAAPAAAAAAAAAAEKGRAGAGAFLPPRAPPAAVVGGMQLDQF